MVVVLVMNIMTAKIFKQSRKTHARYFSSCLKYLTQACQDSSRSFYKIESAITLASINHPYLLFCI